MVILSCSVSGPSFEMSAIASDKMSLGGLVLALSPAPPHSLLNTFPEWPTSPHLPISRDVSSQLPNGYETKKSCQWIIEQLAKQLCVHACQGWMDSCLIPFFSNWNGQDGIGSKHLSHEQHVCSFCSLNVLFKFGKKRL